MEAEYLARLAKARDEHRTEAVALRRAGHLAAAVDAFRAEREPTTRPRISPKSRQDIQEHARSSLRTKKSHLAAQVPGSQTFGFRARAPPRAVVRLRDALSLCATFKSGHVPEHAVGRHSSIRSSPAADADLNRLDATQRIFRCRSPAADPSRHRGVAATWPLGPVGTDRAVGSRAGTARLTRPRGGPSCRRPLKRSRRTASPPRTRGSRPCPTRSPRGTRRNSPQTWAMHLN